MKCTIFLDITSCSLLKANRCFGGVYRLLLQSRTVRVACHLLLPCSLAQHIRPWRWWRYSASKCRLAFNGLHPYIPEDSNRASKLVVQALSPLALPGHVDLRTSAVPTSQYSLETGQDKTDPYCNGVWLSLLNVFEQEYCEGTWEHSYSALVQLENRGFCPLLRKCPMWTQAGRTAVFILCYCHTIPMLREYLEIGHSPRDSSSLFHNIAQCHGEVISTSASY
jgi:hypothetical protein